MRVGIHTGSVVTGVVGTLRPRFHVFGSSMLVAEEMESTGLEGKVQCSKVAHDAFNDSHFEFSARVNTSAKLLRQLQRRIRRKNKRKTAKNKRASDNSASVERGSRYGSMESLNRSRKTHDKGSTPGTDDDAQ